jgi:hypothetical protein
MGDTLLHQNAVVQCKHLAPARPVMTNLRVKVGSQAIVTQLNGYTISGCSNPTNAGGPCATAQWLTAALRVKAGGDAVLLKSSQSVCAPNGTALTIVSTQQRVSGT